MEERRVKKVTGRSNKNNTNHDNEERKEVKQKTVMFAEEDQIIPTKQKRGDDGKSMRGHQIEKINKHFAEEEQHEDLGFEDNFDDEWEDEEDKVDKLAEEEEEEFEGEDETETEKMTREFGGMQFSDAPVVIERNDFSKKKNQDEAIKAYLGTNKNLNEGEVLEFDNSAYDLFHRANTEWPCLSLDVLVPEHNTNQIVQPSKFEIKEYPLTVYVVAGTQAPKATDNSIYFMKWSQLHKTKDDDESVEMGYDEGDDVGNDDEASFNVLGIKHNHGVNRIRSMNGSSIVALWDESGTVSIYDGTKHTELLVAYNEEEEEALAEAQGSHSKKGLKAPKDSNKKNFLLSAFKHSSEGYALQWSPHTLGLFATGSCDKKVHLYTLADENGSSWIMDTTPFTVHKGSVEDLVFSPQNQNLLASCSVDGTIQFIDFRSDNKKKAEASIKVGSTDVNVISWSSAGPNLIAAGSDDGSIKVWDIRYINKARAVAEIEFHKEAITSIDFQPFEDSVITVASADNRVTVWDFSVEADMKSKSDEIPEQLMFIHQGIEDVKEVRHHPYMSELVLTTAANGFNVFKPNYEEEHIEEEY